MLATSLDPFTTTFQPAQKLYRLFLTVLCCFRALSTSRQLCPRALSPSSSQRSTTCTLTFSAPRKSHVGIACTHDTSTDKKHHHDLFKDSLHDTGNHLVNHFSDLCSQSHFWHAYRAADHPRLLHLAWAVICHQWHYWNCML
jgi:hypothetical protein